MTPSMSCTELVHKIVNFYAAQGPLVGIEPTALGIEPRAVGSIPTRGPCASFFAVVPDQFLKCIYTHLDYKP